LSYTGFPVQSHAQANSFGAPSTMLSPSAHVNPFWRIKDSSSIPILTNAVLIQSQLSIIASQIFTSSA